MRVSSERRRPHAIEKNIPARRGGHSRHAVRGHFACGGNATNHPERREPAQSDAGDKARHDFKARLE
jgi:hypothetical protein